MCHVLRIKEERPSREPSELVVFIIMNLQLTPAAVLEDAQLDVDLLGQQHARVVVLLVDARTLLLR